MKRVLLSLAVAFCMVAAVNAQFVIGGGIELGGQLDKSTKNGNTADKYSAFNLGLTPSFGYVIKDKYEIGLGLNFAYSHNSYYTMVKSEIDSISTAKAELDYRTPSFSWAVNPYARFRIFKVNRFAFWIEAIVSLGTSLDSKTKYFAYGVQGSTSTWRTSTEADKMNELPQGYSYTRFNGSFYVQPVLTYAVTKHLILQSQLQLLSLGLGGSIEKKTTKLTGEDKSDPLTSVTVDNSFNWGLGLLQGRAISLGVVYKF